MYDNAGDAHMRLSESIIRYKGVPVFVHNVREDMTVNFSLLSDGSPGTAPCTDPDFDITPVPTGYVNYHNDSSYVQRVPCRRWKQGLSRDGVEASPAHGGSPPARDLVSTPEMAATIMDEYPPFLEALSQVRTGASRAAAYHRFFCFVRNEMGLVWLWYKGVKVGWMEQDIPMLGVQFQYLYEELRETLP